MIPSLLRANDPHDLLTFANGAPPQPAGTLPDSLEAAAEGLSGAARGLLRGGQFVVWALDRNGVFRFCEGNALHLLGLQDGTMPLGRSIYDLFGHLPPILDGVDRAFAEGTSIVAVKLRGVVLDLWQTALLGSGSAQRGLLGVATDVVRGVLAAEASQSWEERFKALTGHVPDMILVVDRDGQIDFVNHTPPGNDPRRVIGTSVYEWVPVEHHPRMRACLTRVLESGQPDSFETPSIGPNGTTAWYRTRVGPIKRDGKVIGLTLITTDVTDCREAEQRLRAEQRFLRYLLEVHERDRKLAAYELHDGMIQQVTGALMHLEALRYKAPLAQKEPEEFKLALRLLREAVAEGRRLISGLRPPAIDELGLIAALEALVQEHVGAERSIEFRHEGDFSRLDRLVEANLFRIAQEILTNVQRHSQARHVTLELLRQGDGARLIAGDDGVGFDPAAVPPDRYGLQGIRERARLLHGRADIRSAPGQGTHITVELPHILPFCGTLERAT